MAAGAILGVYLLIGELAGVDFARSLQHRRVGLGRRRVPVVAAAAVQRLDRDDGFGRRCALPFKAVLGEQFANNFTGLVGGTVATTALVIRFFQKQGQKVAVAASSGVLNSLAPA